MLKMATRFSRMRKHSPRLEISTPVSGIMRFFACLLLIVQLGAFAHVIEHYLLPEQMECGEDSCAAFAPATGSVLLPDFAAALVLLVFFIRFWAVHAPSVEQPCDRLGFQAHAPPF
jgi:hypothetical protein